MTPLRTKESISSEIGITLQPFHVDTVVDANYETFDSTATYPNLRAQSTTKDDVGLGIVENYDIATKQEAEVGTATNKYMTPLRTKESISSEVGVTLQSYNQHTVVDENYETFNSSETYPNLRAQATTKDDVGLSNVINEKQATEANFDAHIIDFDNHTGDATIHFTADSVTKENVDLDNVENYPIALKEEAQLAETNERYMTPLRTRQFLDEADIDGGEF